MSDHLPAYPSDYSPYRDPRVGDIILRTSDGIQLYVHRRRIVDASTVFADMFSLASPSLIASEKKRTIDVSESSTVWEKLLPFVYLAEEPTLALDDIHALIEAGKKYHIPGVTSHVRFQLFRPDFLEQQPLAVYALACSAGYIDVARAAARRTLRIPIYPTFTKELSHVTGNAVYNLLEFRRKCGIAASSAVMVKNERGIPEWMESNITTGMGVCNAPICKAKTVHVSAGGQNRYSIRRAYLEYLGKLEQLLLLDPDGSLAHQTSLLDPIIASASDCLSCVARIYVPMVDFAKKVEHKIEEEISKVSA